MIPERSNPRTERASSLRKNKARKVLSLRVYKSVGRIQLSIIKGNRDRGATKNKSILDWAVVKLSLPMSLTPSRTG